MVMEMEEVESGDQKGLYICKLCMNYKPKEKGQVVRHLEQKHNNHKLVWMNHTVYLCNRGCHQNGKGHYHCPRCGHISDRIGRLRVHLSNNCATKGKKNNRNTGNAGMAPGHPLMSSSKCEEVDKEGNENNETGDDAHTGIEDNQIPVTGQKQDDESTGLTGASSRVSAPDEVAEEQVEEGKVRCPYCPKPNIMWRQNLKLHIRRNHTSEEEGIASLPIHQGACVDRNNGIYLVSETPTGIQHPVHVQKLIRGNTQAQIQCESKECIVDKTIKGMSGEPTCECGHLRSANFLPMAEEVILNEENLDICLNEHRISEETKRDCLLRQRDCEGRGMALVNAMCPRYATDRWVFLSVWTGYKKWYCTLGRVVITFDTKNFKIVCKCSGSSRIGCAHKPIAKWFLRTVYEDLFLETASPVSYLSDKLRLPHSSDTEYLYEKKRIPGDMVMPSSEQFPDDMIVCPTEESCPSCDGNLVLGDSYKNVKLLTRCGFVTIERVWTKKCDVCSSVVSPYDISKGYLNWNNRYFVSLGMLLWLQAAIREHKAIGTELIMMEKVYRMTIEHQIVRLTFYKFLALLNDDDNFHCYLCGDYPVILTFDVTRKVCFKLGRDSVRGAQNDQVNGKQFWDDVRKYLLAPETDRSMMPSMEYWAPFIPEKNRKGDMVFNTEFKKGRHDDEEQQYLECLSAETLEDLFDIADVRTLRELCAECGINARDATRFKCMELLINALKNKTRIDKFFIKIWHSSGGLLTASCPHGCVYCLKFLMTPESVRDPADILESMKHPPSIVISDIPHVLGPHMNRRTGREFFNPHCGRVAEPTEENIKKVEKGLLQESVGWLDRRYEKVTPDLNVEGTNIQPITVTTQRYSLCDRFHERNTTQRKEFLRRTGLIKELVGVNTETAEQVNSYLEKSLTYLDCTSAVHHIVEVKAMLALRNIEINEKILGSRELLFDACGRLVSRSTFDPQRSQTTQSQQGSRQNISVHPNQPQSQPNPQPPLAQKVYPQTQPSQPQSMSQSPPEPKVNPQFQPQPNSKPHLGQQAHPQPYPQPKSKPPQGQQTQPQSPPQPKSQPLPGIQPQPQPGPQQKKHGSKYSLRRKADPDHCTVEGPPPQKSRKLSNVSYSFKTDELEDDEMEGSVYLVGEEQFLRKCIKGLPNPRNNCWVNAVIVAIRNSIGASRLWEDQQVMDIYSSNEAVFTNLEPLLKETSMISAVDHLDSELMKSCLLKQFPGEIGQHQDPHGFFLLLSGLLDSFSPGHHVYGIETVSTFKCINKKCDYSSQKTDVELSVSVGLGPNGEIPTCLDDLVARHYQDEEVQDACTKCGHALKISKVVQNKPDVIVVQLKRYISGVKRKRTDLVTPSTELDMAATMSTANRSKYLLNAVITHKGASVNSGHYTTTLIHDDVRVEIDDMTVSITEGKYIDTEGYIFLYENVDSRSEIVKKWFPLTMLLAGMVNCDLQDQLMLTQALLHLRNSLGEKDASLIRSAELLKVLSRKLGRTLSSSGKNKKDDMWAMLNLLGYKDHSCSFSLGFECSGCSLKGKHILSFDVLKCNADIQSINEFLKKELRKQNCHACPDAVIVEDGDAVFLSEMMVMETKHVDSHTLSDPNPFTHYFKGLYGEYVVLCGLRAGEAFLHKDERWFSTSGYTILSSESFKKDAKSKILLAKGNLCTTVHLSIESTKVDVSVVPPPKKGAEHRKFLETCLTNIADDVGTEDGPWTELTFKTISKSREILALLLSNDMVTDRVGEEVLFSRIFHDACVIPCETEEEFAVMSLAALLPKMVSKMFGRSYTIIDMQESVIVIHLNNNVVRVYLFGTHKDHKEKLLHLCNVLFSGMKSIIVSNTPVMGKASHRLQLLKLVYCVTQGIPLSLDHDLGATLATLFAGMPSIGSPELENALAQKCRFYDTVRKSLTTLPVLYYMPNNGELFVLATNGGEVAEKVKHRFLLSNVGMLHEDLIPEILNFIIRKKELIKKLYFLEDSNATEMLKLLNNSSMYSHQQSRFSLVDKRRKGLLKNYPSMLYFCTLAALEVVTSEKTGYVNNGILGCGTFRIDEFIELHILKTIVHMFVVEICDKPHHPLSFPDMDEEDNLN